VLRHLRRGDHDSAAAALRHHIIDSLERDARLSAVSLSLKRIARGQTAARARAPSPRRP